MLDKRSKNGEQRVEARYSSKKEDNTEKKKDFIWEKEKDNRERDNIRFRRTI
jgi:hypothetical protein